MNAPEGFRVGRLHIGENDWVDVAVTERLVRLAHTDDWELVLSRPQAIRLSQILETAVAWWPPREEPDESQTEE